jgi:hypothetical protein
VQSNAERKNAIHKFKERKPSRGVFAIRCLATGQFWVGSSPNLEAKKNGSWFSLRIGSHRAKGLQNEWNTYCEDAFEYEVLEKLADDVSPLAVADFLKEKRLEWLAQLRALPV